MSDGAASTNIAIKSPNASLLSSLYFLHHSHRSQLPPPLPSTSLIFKQTLCAGTAFTFTLTQPQHYFQQPPTTTTIKMQFKPATIALMATLLATTTLAAPAPGPAPAPQAGGVFANCDSIVAAGPERDACHKANQKRGIFQNCSLVAAGPERAACESASHKRDEEENQERGEEGNQIEERGIFQNCSLVAVGPERDACEKASRGG